MNNREGGFTIPEILTGLCVTSICMFMLSGLLSSSTGLFARSRDRILTAVSLIRADTRIRAGLGAVVIPYWEGGTGGVQILQAGEEILIPWYGGIREHTLSFRIEGAGLVMETRDNLGTEQSILMESANRITMTLLEDENQIPRGIDFCFTRSGAAFHSLAYFSCAPLAGGALAGGEP
ncbi:MAG: hypothetical protein LBO80_00750 [Treponema sp.]|jgi:hypothetical protein|nr:hypothetical protein [Treponema sp.]